MAIYKRKSALKLFLWQFLKSKRIFWADLKNTSPLAIPLKRAPHLSGSPRSACLFGQGPAEGRDVDEYAAGEGEPEEGHGHHQDAERPHTTNLKGATKLPIWRKSAKGSRSPKI